VKAANLGLRFGLELAALTSLIWWGFSMETPSILVRIVAGVGTAVVVRRRLERVRRTEG
jgi:Protein of unknown function (DUF2568)